MQKIFHHILVPVEFDRNTNAVIEKAIAFAERLDCHLHLVHVMTRSVFHGKHNEARRQYRIYALRERYQDRIRQGLKLFATLLKGEKEDSITLYAEQYGIDMIVLQKQPRWWRPRVNEMAIAAKTNCPVLSASYTTDLQQFRIIVLPIGSFLPVNKIRIAIYLAKQFDAAIHLLALEKNGVMHQDLACMKKAFQVLKDNTSLPVMCNTMPGSDLAAVALQYAKSVKAGIIMVNPGSESAFVGQHQDFFARLMINESKTPVMSGV